MDKNLGSQGLYVRAPYFENFIICKKMLNLPFCLKKILIFETVGDGEKKLGSQGS